MDESRQWCVRIIALSLDICGILPECFYPVRDRSLHSRPRLVILLQLWLSECWIAGHQHACFSCFLRNAVLFRLLMQCKNWFLTKYYFFCVGYFACLYVCATCAHLLPGHGSWCSVPWAWGYRCLVSQHLHSGNWTQIFWRTASAFNW